MEAIVDASQIQSGELIGGRYRLQEKIGEGGMASVWRAVDSTLERPVALKFLYIRDPRRRAQLVTAFLREAKIAASVRHRYVVGILDFGTIDDTTPYMVMELLEGESLGRMLERKGALSAEMVIDLAAHVLEGLAAVHEAGIVHRDLKPDNVFIQRELTRTIPKLLDFGISRSVDPEGGRQSALTTQDGTLVGTPEYMSPEQASGEGKVDLRTDLYSLGVIIYEALTGRLPFEADGIGSLIVQIITGQCPSVRDLRPDLPPALSEFVAKAMAKDREERFADAVQMHHALLAVAESSFGGQLAQAISIPPSPGVLLGGEPTILSGVVVRPNQLRPAVAGLRAADARAPDAAGPSGRARAGRGVLMWLSAIAASAGTALGITYLAQRPDPAAASERFIVVRDAQRAGADEPPSEIRTAPEPSARAEHTQAEPQLDSVEELAPRAEAPAHEAQAEPPVKARKQTPEAALARTFARYKPQIAACFEAGAEAPALSLRLALDLAGRVQTVEVSPEGAAASALGKCVVRVARSIEFGPQTRQLSLRVPIAVRTER